MQQMWWWVLGTIIILGVGYAYLGYDKGEMMQDDSMMKADEMMEGDMKKDDSMVKDEGAMMDKKDTSMEKMEKEEGAMMQKGSYEPYSTDKLSRADSGDVVLFFRASWCPTCKALDANIRANLAAIPGGLTILDVDYDNSSELKKKYGVTYQHTLVQVRSDGSFITKWSGSPTLAALVAQVQ